MPGFNMKYINKFLVVIIISLIPTTHLNAKTCAERLTSTGRWLVVGAIASTIIIPLYGLGFATMGSAIYNKKTVDRNILRLNAASIIARYQAAPHNDINREITKAYKIFDQFYARLEHKFPEMRFSKLEVVDWLDKVNRMDLGKRGCEALKWNSIGFTYFADGRIKEWQQVADEEAELNREKIEAAQCRNEKNQDFLYQKMADESFIEID
jgi:hypothetical protein